VSDWVNENEAGNPIWKRPADDRDRDVRDVIAAVDNALQPSVSNKE
jgi:hypothetical protein